MGLDKEDISILHDKAEKVIERARIREEDFLEPDGPYTRESVERDLEIVRRKEESFGKDRDEYFAEQKKLADIFEALVIEHGELSQWFGENAYTVKTSRYDDYENGVDAVIEFRDEESSASHLGMGVDVTFSRDTSAKFDRVKKQIEKGRLTRIKYFHSDHLKIHGQLYDVPEVIIGADKKTVLELAELWERGKNSELGRHRIQIMILHQMQEQLDAFASYASSLGQDGLARLYREKLAIIDQILESKADIAKNVGYDILSDQVHSGMMNFLARWKEEIDRSTTSA